LSTKTLGTIEKAASILIIVAVENETRKLADALAGDYHISAAPNITEAVKRLTRESFNAIIFDLVGDSPDLAGILESLKLPAPDTPVIVLGHENDAQLIVGAIKAGA